MPEHKDTMLPAGDSTSADSAHRDPRGLNGGDAADNAGAIKKKSSLILKVAESALLFRTPDGTAYADIDVNGHRETWAVRSPGFKRWLARGFHEKTGGAPSSEAMQEALGVIEANAFFGPVPTMPIFTRVAEHDGALYLDLCDTDWRVIEIDAAGWDVATSVPVRFRRASNMLPLPMPVGGGDLAELRRFLNVHSDDFKLVVAYLQASLRPVGPYPILAFAGEEGTAKSTSASVIKRLIDANKLARRSLPRDERDLFIGAKSNQVLVFDNVSGLPLWLSDAFCKLATGGGVGARSLYTNDDETVIDAMRPLILTGIEDIATRGDLAGRTIPIPLAPIDDEARRDEVTFWREYDEAHPEMLGALLDSVVVGLRTMPTMKLKRLPRMADFTKWAHACDGCKGNFLAAYERNRATAVATVIENDLVASAVMAFMADRVSWEGTATELLTALIADDATKHGKDWPTTAHGLSVRLRRVATALRKSGIGFKQERTGRARSIRLFGDTRE